MKLAILFVVLNICSSYLINTKLQFIKTYFPGTNYPKKNINNARLNFVYAMEKPLYILVWYNCELCKDLILELEKLNIKYIYINSSIYFKNIEDSVFQDPLFYKEETLIGENLYDIYEEIYKAGDY